MPRRLARSRPDDLDQPRMQVTKLRPQGAKDWRRLRRKRHDVIERRRRAMPCAWGERAPQLLSSTGAAGPFFLMLSMAFSAEAFEV
jgi:hypothetical protein